MLSPHPQLENEERRHWIVARANERFSPFSPWSVVERKLTRFSFCVVILSAVISNVLIMFGLVVVVVVQFSLALLCLAILAVARHALALMLVGSCLPARLEVLGAFSLRPASLTMVFGLSALLGTAGSFLWAGSVAAGALVIGSAGLSISLLVGRSFRP